MHELKRYTPPIFVGLDASFRTGLAGIGFKVNDAASLELGYLNQIVQRANGTVFEHNHTLQVSLFYNLNFSEN